MELLLTLCAVGLGFVLLSQIDDLRRSISSLTEKLSWSGKLQGQMAVDLARLERQVNFLASQRETVEAPSPEPLAAPSQVMAAQPESAPASSAPDDRPAPEAAALQSVDPLAEAIHGPEIVETPEVADTSLAIAADRVEFAERQSGVAAEAVEPERPDVPAKSPGAAAVPHEAPASRAKVEFKPDFDPMRWAVWAGGAAVAFGGMFLIKQMVEAGFFGPGARVFFGLALSLALLWVGEKMRFGYRRLPADSFVAAVVTAAGLALAYAVVAAAYGLYGFIGPDAALLLLGGVGGGAIVLARRHTLQVGLMGLLGAYAAPAVLVSTGLARPELVFYLAAVSASVHAIDRRQGGRLLSVCAAAASGLWTLAFVSGQAPGLLAAHLAVQGLMVAYVLVALPIRDKASDGIWKDLPVFALTVLAVVIGLCAHFQDENGPAFALAVVMLLGLFAAAVLVEELFMAAVIAPVMAAWMALTWPHDGDLVPFGYTLFVALFGLLGFAAVVARFLRNRPGAEDMRLASVANLMLPLAGVGVALSWRHDLVHPNGYCGAALLATALAAAASAFACYRAEGAEERPASATLFFARAATLVSVAAAVSGLGRFSEPTAIAGIALAAVIAGSWPLLGRLAQLGVAVAAGACLLGLAVFAGEMNEGFPSLSEIVLLLGLPAALLAAAGRQVRALQAGEPWQSLIDAAWMAAGLSFGMALIHLGAGTLAPEHGRWILLEAASHFVLIATASFLIARVAHDRPSLFMQLALYVAKAWLALHGIFILLLAANPYFSGEPVAGVPIVNELTAGYLVPAAILFALRRKLPKGDPMALAWGVTGGILCLAWATLSVRHAFHGPYLAGDALSQGETLSYSAAWVACGILATVLGSMRGITEVKLGGSAVLMAATLKVFLFDMNALTGMMRALSFIGLGVSLIAIAVFVRAVGRIEAAGDKPSDAETG